MLNKAKYPWLPPTKKKFILLVCLFVLVFQSACNMYIEKRRYNHGYYINLNHTPIKRMQTGTHTINHRVYVKKTKMEEVELITQKPAIDSLKPLQDFTGIQKNKYRGKKKSYSTVLHPTNKCDIIRLFNGTEMEVMIQHIDKKTTTYKKCGDPDGPVIQIRNNTIREIVLTNGKTYQPRQLVKIKGISHDYTQVTGGMIGAIILAGLALICIVIALLIMFGGLGFPQFSAIPLALAGTLSLIGVLWSARFLVKGGHILGKIAFIVHLVLQIAALILTIFMGILFY